MPIFDTKDKTIGEYCSTYDVDNESEQSKQKRERTEDYINNIEMPGGYKEIKEKVKSSMEELKKLNQLHKSILNRDLEDANKKENIIKKLREIENQNNINNRNAGFYYKEKTRFDVIIDVLLAIYVILIIASVAIIITKKYKDYKLFLIIVAFIIPLFLFNIVYDFIALKIETPKEPVIQGDLTLKTIELSSLFKKSDDYNFEEEKKTYEQSLSMKNEIISDLENKISGYEETNQLYERVSEEISKLIQGSITEDEIKRLLNANVSAKNISALTNNTISENEINSLLAGNF